MDQLQAALADLEQARADFHAWLAENDIDLDSPDREFVREISDRQKIVNTAASAVQAAISNHLRGDRD